MALYLLPDGRQLDIPDTASKEELIEIQNNLAQLYPETYSAYDSSTGSEVQGRTFFGNLEEVAKGVPRGFASTMLSAGEGVSSLFSAGNDSAAVDLFKNLQKGLNESALGVDKGYEDAFSSKFGQGLGSFASFFVPGAAVGKVTGLGGKVLAGGAGAKEAAKQLAKLQTGAVLPLAVPVGISEQAQNIELARSLGEEVGFGQEIASELLGGVIGASEIYSVQKLLKGIAKAPGKYYKIPERIRSAIQTGSAEAAQEALAGIAQDAVALGIYSDEIPLGDSLFDDLTVGGAVGAVSDLVFRGALGRRSAGDAYLRKQAEDAQEQEDIRFEEYQERYEQAVADGSVVLPSQLETAEQQAEKNPYAKVIYGDLAGTDLTALSDAELDSVALEYQEAMKFYENKPKYKDVYENFVGSFNALKIERQSRKGPSPEDERELPILETHTIKFNPDGTYSVVGNDSGVTKGTFETDNEARNQALQLDKTVRQVWLSTVVDNAIKINGLDMSGTSYVIGQRVYDPLQNTFDAKVLANYDSRVSPARKEQYKEEKKLSKKEQAIIDRQEFYKLSNVMKDNMLRDLLGPQVDALTESELSALREQLDQLPNIYPTYKQRTRKGKDGKVRPVVGQFDPATPEDAARLEDVTSQLSIFYDKLQGRGIEKKNFYSLAEAKKILKPEDFNALLKEKSEIQFQISAILNEKIGVKRNKKGEVDVSPTALKEAFDKKNIDIDLNSDAFKYFAESVTGTPLYNKMTNGQKQLLISRVLTLPRYNSKRLLPDFSPRPYTAKQLDNFYKANIGQKVTLKQIKEQIKNLETGKPLTQKETQKLKQDLVDSGRAVISKNRLEMTQDYDLQKARKADDPRSTPEELRERLRNTTELQDIEIEQIVANQASSDAEILSQQDLKMLPPPSNPQKYGKLLEEMRERLNALGLKDISLRFDNALRDSLRVKQDPETGRYYFQQTFSEGTYDRPMKTVLVSLEKADPDLSKTEEELKDSIAQTVDHEAVHALIDLNLLTDKEMKILKDTANRVFTEEQIAEMRSNYPNLPEPNFQEELVAELFAVYRSNPDIIRAPKPKNIIERILQFLSTFAKTIGNGFATPTSVLTDIASGEIGARQRGQIRSLHKLDKEIAQNPDFLETINPIVGDAATDRNRKDLDELNSIEKAIEQNIQEYRRGVAEMKVGEESNYPPDRIAGERVMKKASSNIKKFNKRKKVLLKKIGGVQQDLFTDVLASDIPTDRAKSIELQYSKEEKDPSELLTKIDMRQLIIGPKFSDGSGFTSILIRGKQRVRHMMFGTAIDRRKDPNGNYADEFYIYNKSDKEKRAFNENDYVGKVLAFIDNNSTQNRPRAVGIQNIELEESARGKNIGQKTIEMLASTNPDIVSGKRDLEIYDIQDEAKGFWEALGSKTFKREKGPRSQDKSIDGTLRLEENKPIDLPTNRIGTAGLTLMPESSVAVVDNGDSLFSRDSGVGLSFSMMQKPFSDSEFFSSDYRGNYRAVFSIGKIIDDRTEYAGRAELFLDKKSFDKYQKAEGQDTGLLNSVPIVGLVNINILPAMQRQNIGRDVIELIASSNPDVRTGRSALYINDIKTPAVGFWERLGTEFKTREKGFGAGKKLDGEIKLQTEQVLDLPTDRSRASTATEAAYMDMPRNFINQLSTESVEFFTTNEGEFVEVPRWHFTRMPIDAFLKLTTKSDSIIDDISIKASTFGKFDPAKENTGQMFGGYPYLRINGDGKVLGHEGRHRASLLKIEGANTIPVSIEMSSDTDFTTLINEQNKTPSEHTIQDMNIAELKGQYRDNYSFPTNILNIAPVIRGDNNKRLRAEQLQNAYAVIEAPDFSRDMDMVSLAVDLPTDRKQDIDYRGIGIATAQPGSYLEGYLRKSELLERDLQRDAIRREEGFYGDATADLLDLDVSDIPTDRLMSSSGILPENILFPGEVEKQLLNLYTKNDGNITAKQFKSLFKKIAPRSSKKHSFPSYESLMADVQDSIDKGMDYQWYKKWAIKMPNIVGDVNMNEFSKVFGITSAQAKPEQNLKATLGIMALAREVKNNNDISDFNKSNISKLKTALRGKQTEYFLSKDKIDMLATLYETGQMVKTGTGMKTALYANQILSDSNNQFSPWSVVDRHMLTKLGFNTKSPTETEYRMAQAMLSLLSTETYNRNGREFQFPDPSAAQAILWAHERYGKVTATNEGSVDSAIKFSSKEIENISKMKQEGLFDMDHPISGMFIHNPRFQSNRKNNPFDSNLSNQMFDSIVRAAPSVAFEFKMGVNRGYLPEGFNVSFEEHLNYMENLLKDVTSGNQLRVLRTLGIPHEISISAGTYENNLTPNIVLKLPGADKTTVEGVAGLLTDAFLQDSAVISRPTSEGVQTGLLLRKPNNEKFEQAELDQLMQRFSELSRDNQEVNFTVLPSEQNAVMLIDPRSFGNENYDTSDIDQFVGIIREATNNTNYALETYGQESELIQYKKAPDTKGTSRSLRLLGDKAGILGSSDIQRAVISDLYIPAFENYRRFARRNGIEPVNDLPIYSRRSALYGQLNDQGILGGISTEEWQARANRKAEQASRNHIPRINTKADPLALAVAFQMAEGKSIDNIFDEVNRDIPTDKRTSAKIPSGYEQAHEDIGGTNHLDKDFGSSMIDWADTKQTVSQTLQGLRVALIDKLTAVERKLIEAGEKSTEAKILLNTIDTNAMADLRFSERARGVFASMIKYGVPVLREGGTYVENFEAGGLLEIFAPLYENTKIDLEALFKIYAIGKRGTRLDAEGIPTPVTPEVIEQMKNIEAQYPEVVQVYNNYQKWNNELINYAVSQGILSETKSINELINLITSESGNYTRAMLLNLSREDLVTLAETLQIDTRGTAQIWRDNSDYYPFYRKMQDDSIRGPKIAGGFVAGNPLGIQITGSESAIEPSPLEAIARNSLSIVTAAMKNSGLAKMMDTFEAAQMAQKVDPRDAKGSDIVPVFVDGEKIFYRVDDPQIVAGLQSLGMNDMSGILKFLAMPASFLRDMVTRDPGFMLVNMMRDTMSAFVTSGADFKPFIDTFKNFNADFSELERWGVLGGYDFSNDEMDIVKFIQKEMRKQGIGSDGSMNATEQFVKLWDFLGEQTGKSDGATRKGVYDVIYQQTGSQREAAYQALEVINFSRRGADPLFRVITAAIPFLNARLQGLDLIYRGSRGEYSAVRSQLEGTSAEIAKQIQMKMFMRGGMLMFLTAMYYALVSDDEEYKKISLEERDDNWVIPLGEGIPAFKLPIPFEIGTIFKVIPERIIDVMMGGEVADLAKSYQRQLANTLKIDPLGFQAIKPIVEVVNNRSTYTGSEIVPYYMREGLEPSAQSRYSTNELARLIGEQLNISPLKLEYIMQGYGGTLGGYLLSMIDATLRQATDRDFLSPRIDQVPVLKRLFTSTEFGRGLEQQFYELRKESNRYVQTLNSFKKQGRTEEAKAYMANRKGIAKTRQQVLAINRWLQSWRDRRDRILNSDMSPRAKKELIEQLQLQKAKRLAYVPQLREMSDLPVRFFE